jgi:lysozyme family protein
MVASNFERCLANVIVSEGGYSDDVHDPGGATMNGITQAEYNSWRISHQLPLRWVRWLTEVERRDIYKTHYWDRVGGDSLPSGLDYCVFDEAVNSGVARALKALRSMDPDCPLEQEIIHFNTLRLDSLKGLSTWRYFGEGWKARVEKVERIALKMVTQKADSA